MREEIKGGAKTIASIVLIIMGAYFILIGILGILLGVEIMIIPMFWSATEGDPILPFVIGILSLVIGVLGALKYSR